LLVVPGRGAVPPGDIAVRPDEDGASAPTALLDIGQVSELAGIRTDGADLVIEATHPACRRGRVRAGPVRRSAARLRRRAGG
jgi:hypothetical protein